MIFRKAISTDIKQIRIIRNAVLENRLSDPNAISDEDCLEFLTVRGQGWICEIDDKIVGFSIIDLKDNNVWALFLLPAFEHKGIGRRLHDLMIDWYFKQTQKTVWLGTSPNTRAEGFYKKLGWVEVGMHGSAEVKFEMTHKEWTRLRKENNI